MNIEELHNFTAKNAVAKLMQIQIQDDQNFY